MSRRLRITEGIYRDRYGLGATVKVGRIQREKRFPIGTKIEVMQSWRTQMRAELDEAGPHPVTGTLETDAARFLARRRKNDASDRSHLSAWYPKFGKLLRSRITATDCQAQIDAWVAGHVAARTIRHRRRLLRALYRTLDGPRVKTPVDYVKLPKIPDAHPVAVPIATIQKVAKALAKRPKARKVYARFLIRAVTGQRPAQVMRAQPSDIDFQRKLWFVRSAKGGHPVPFPLNAEAIRAWKLFAAADAWGTFAPRQDARVLRRAGWPTGIRPQALRSTFAIDLLLKGANLGEIQGLLGHKQIQTTRSHYGPVLVALLKAVTQTRRLGIVPTTSRAYQPTMRSGVEILGKQKKRSRLPAAPKHRKVAS